MKLQLYDVMKERIVAIVVIPTHKIAILGYSLF